MIKQTISVLAISMASLYVNAAEITPIDPNVINQIIADAQKSDANKADYRKITQETDSKLSHYNDKLRKYAASGVAGAAAMNSIPAVPGKEFSVGAAVGGYDDQKALAAGFNFTPSNAPVAFKGSVAATSEDVVFGTGFAVGF